jgi:protein-tyrosine phosphatase
VVLQDYLVTNRVFKQPPSAQGGLSADVLAVLWRVQPGFLDAALHAVDTDHGGVERYLGERLGLGPAALRSLADRYLQPA